ncbi:DEAD-box ATP-dependent RNA helicase 50 [Linum grandiflorum]
MAARATQFTQYSSPLSTSIIGPTTSHCRSSCVIIVLKRPSHGGSRRTTSIHASTSSSSRFQSAASRAPVQATDDRDSDNEFRPPPVLFLPGVQRSATIRTKGQYVNSSKLTSLRSRILKGDASSTMEKNVEKQEKEEEEVPASRSSASRGKQNSLDAPNRRRVPRRDIEERMSFRDDERDNNVHRRSNFRSTSYDKPPRSDFKRFVPESPRSRGYTASSSRRWGDEGGVGSFRPRSHFPPPAERQYKPSPGDDFFSRKSFRDVGCKEFIVDALKAQLFQRPSQIQAMAFAPVMEGKTCVIADQSGSGKTLAYLIPAIQRIKDEEAEAVGESAAPKNPQVFIMVPTAELASQVLNNCRSISKSGVPFRSMVATGGFRQKTQLETLEQGVDVLIATPGRFLFLIKQGVLKLEDLRCAVLDEIDILFKDDDFEAALQLLINSSPITAQYLFVTATLPVDVYNKLVEMFPDCTMIMGPSMHRTSVGLEEVLVDCSGDIGAEKTPETAFDNKKSALLQLAEQSPVSKTIIFCNKIETCRKVENVLTRFDRKGVQARVLPFHAALAQESRVANMKEFMKPNHSTEQSLFLVCTDRASRGIDFAGVDHVVLFDFPRDPSEYVRRVGRTARGAGGKGKAFAFVVGKQVSLARKIIDRNQKGHPLHDVPAAYELMP